MNRAVLAFACSLFSLSVFAAEPKTPETNIVFRNATIYDGTGQAPVTGDVHIKGAKIAAVGKVGKVEGATEVDAAGLVVCPGFIDLHTHCDSISTSSAGRTRTTSRKESPRW